jgi:hypothetical protein
VGCNGGKIGHIGLNSFNWEEQSCEIDNIIRGNSLEPGAMSKALEMVNWYGQESFACKEYLFKDILR